MFTVATREIILIVLAVLIVGCGPAATPASPTATLVPPPPTAAPTVEATREVAEVTFVDNDGFLITIGHKRILIDALYEGDPRRVLRPVVDGQSPFDGVDIMLVTHDHSDHFSPDLVLRYMQNNPDTILVSTRSVVDQVVAIEDTIADRVVPIQLESGESERIVVDGIALEALYLSHDEPGLLNLGFVITVGQFKFFHTGDLVPDEVPAAYLQEYGLREMGIDVQFVPHFFMRPDRYHPHVWEVVQPRYLIPMHYDYRRPPLDLEATFPNAIVFRDTLESWSLPATAETRLAVAEPASSVSFEKSEQTFASVPTYQIGLADLDGDGDLDAVFSNGQANISQVWLNDGGGFFSDSGQGLGKYGHGVNVGDLDGDGDPDLLINTHENFAPSRVYLNDGHAIFQELEGAFELNIGFNVHLFDLDGDGDLDAVGEAAGAARVFLNDGTGAFSAGEPTFPLTTVWGDLDADGDVDVLVKEEGVGYTVHQNDGTGRFDQHWTQADDAAMDLGDMALEDLDSDGDLDAVITNGHFQSTSHPAMIFINDGTGLFTDSGQRLSAVRNAGVGLGDLDGDGDPDLVLADHMEPCQVWLNDGRGRFADSGFRFGDDQFYRHVHLGDLDGDGDLDIFLAAFGVTSGSNEVWFNTTGASPPPVAPTAQSETDEASPPLVLLGTLIDGTGADPLPNAALVIQNGRIVAVGPRAELSIPPSAQIIDLPQATILPGFINTHVHNAYNSRNLQIWARAGVTTVRDLGQRLGWPYFSSRDRLGADPLNARLIIAGPLVTVPGGYPIAGNNFPSLTITSPEDARTKIGELIDDGIDVVKITLTSGSAPSLSPQEAAAIVATAHERGIPVSAHATTAADLRRALEAGVDDVAHLAVDRVSDELIRRMVEAGVSWVPTLEPLDLRGQDNLRRFVEAGGRVALGNDGGYLQGIEVGMPMREIQAMHDAGMTPMQIIVAATRDAAYVCRQAGLLGTLEVGKVADILVVNGDPLRNLDVLREVQLVIHNGVIIRNEAQEL
jgi:imidazolonepropionase-like amidohydrolase/L-ascorbate metabolism protein UlaG (beta-lactamase superfamily)